MSARPEACTDAFLDAAPQQGDSLAGRTIRALEDGATGSPAIAHMIELLVDAAACRHRFSQ